MSWAWLFGAYFVGVFFGTGFGWQIGWARGFKAARDTYRAMGFPG